ncbi:MBL fold metallo-hydrolase [Sphingomonas sp. RT2P30]|uniref:MBL fold metallo-hydrolase n=1 Tax=Parasphingomonas halimpatiens TaxID=3096162 RepID=UPI002FC5F400
MTAKKLWRGIAVTILLLLSVLAVSVYWLFYDTGPSPRAPYRLDLAAVRAAALRVPGPQPSRIEYEIVSHDAVPRIAMVGRTGWNKIDLVRASYRAVFPDRAIIIDTGYDEQAARNVGADRFDRAAYRRVMRGLDGASLIVVTHEHGDHLGGALTSPHLAQFLPRLLLTRAQADSPQAPPWPASLKARLRPFDYPAIAAIAPGIVLIKAPGHTPGSQMVYVHEADGREFLFLGDAASMADNVHLRHQRSRYVTTFISGDDRAAVAAQLQAIAAVGRENPALILVPGHDGATIEALAAQGVLERNFRF